MLLILILLLDGLHLLHFSEEWVEVPEGALMKMLLREVGSKCKVAVGLCAGISPLLVQRETILHQIRGDGETGYLWRERGVLL